jgi:UPF0271 protein
MEATIRAALRHGAAIGAHPGYPDRARFGRHELDWPADRIADAVAAQVAALDRVARALGARLSHVKPHGALYNRAARDPVLAAVVAGAFAALDPGLVLVGLAGSRSLEAGRDAGLTVLAEAFADRRYEPNGSLRSRTLPGALLGPGAAAQPASAIVRDGRVTASDGSTVAVAADTLCVHGDSPGAAEIARAVRSALAGAGIMVAPWPG